MRSRALFFVCAAGVMLAGGCRQPDGPAPTADGEVPNRLEDISRDLQSIASGDADATRDLAEDLRVFIGDKVTAAPAADELSRRAAGAVSGIRLSDDHALGIARHLWTAVAGRELSERQRENLQSDLRSALLEAGVPDDRIAAVVAQAGEVQNQMTDRRRRWYEVQ